MVPVVRLKVVVFAVVLIASFSAQTLAAGAQATGMSVVVTPRVITVTQGSLAYFAVRVVGARYATLHVMSIWELGSAQYPYSFAGGNALVFPAAGFAWCPGSYTFHVAVQSAVPNQEFAMSPAVTVVVRPYPQPHSKDGGWAAPPAAIGLTLGRADHRYGERSAVTLTATTAGSARLVLTLTPPGSDIPLVVLTASGTEIPLIYKFQAFLSSGSFTQTIPPSYLAGHPGVWTATLYSYPYGGSCMDATTNSVTQQFTVTA